MLAIIICNFILLMIPVLLYRNNKVCAFRLKILNEDSLECDRRIEKVHDELLKLNLENKFPENLQEYVDSRVKPYHSRYDKLPSYNRMILDIRVWNFNYYLKESK